MKLSLNEKQFLILDILDGPIGKKPCCAGDILRASNKAISRGAIFALLSFLETEGYLISLLEEESNFTLPRRLYTITSNGKLMLNVYRKLKQPESSKCEESLLLSAL
ncbi:helix-turn-helix transcriptional regulator [Undibacterium flavidum]|uniref:PadR family transcriptional regulator n=1 Tax=Undibacterium flavidum TaxID=2762297 RepID=A0ABR6YA97_9BURK|nr:helix-turn-helix transcriptional regulator [Undibacterium flavidum]MBC3873482.1 PadR family transcriptional regulator [Undibacterium flavidum]